MILREKYAEVFVENKGFAEELAQLEKRAPLQKAVKEQRLQTRLQKTPPHWKSAS